MATPAKEVAQFLVDLGFYDVIMPFVLVFAIVYGLLQKTKVLGVDSDGDPKKNINLIAAFVAGVAFVVSLSRVLVLASVMQQLAMIAVISSLLMVLLATAGVHNSINKNVGIVAGIMLALLIFSNALGWGSKQIAQNILNLLLHPLVIGIAMFLLIMGYITGFKFSTKETSQTGRTTSEEARETADERPTEETSEEGAGEEESGEGAPKKKKKIIPRWKRDIRPKY